MYFFSAKINKLGINPYVLLPPLIRAKVFKDAGKDKGAIPVRIELNKKQFIQTLVKYKRRWRLYLNGPMRIAAGRDVGDTVEAGIEFDPGDRAISVHPLLKKALQKNQKSNLAFEQLTPSRRKEILRYINGLKTREAIERNIEKVISHLGGKSRFAGRD